MELQKITKQNIAKITGLRMADLLEKNPVENDRLKKLRQQRPSGEMDLLVRGNPQLTLGCVTSIKAVDLYFDKKKKEMGGHE